MTSRRAFLKRASLGLGAVALAEGSAATGAAAGADGRAGAVTEDLFKIAVAGFTFHKFGLEESLQMLQQADVHYLCIKDFHLPLTCSAEQIAAFHALCKGYGVTGYGVGPIYMGTEDAARKAFEYAQRCGVRIVIGVPSKTVEINGKKETIGSRELLQYIEGLCKEFDIKYAVHTHGPDMPLLFPTVESCIELIRDLDERVGVCFDMGHQYRFGRDPIAAMRQYGNRIHDIHIRNVTENTKRGSDTPVPRGKIDIPAFIRAVRETGFAGALSLEYAKDSGDKAKLLLGVAESIGYIRGVADATRG